MTDQTDRFTAAIVQRTVAVTWPGNDRGGATPPPDDWQDRAWGQEPTLHEINEGSISGCSVLHWRDDPRSDADLIAVSLSLVSGEPQRAVAPPTAELRAASSAGRAPAADRAAVYAEVAARLAADAEAGDKDGLTRIYRRSASRQVRAWANELADEAQQSGEPQWICKCPAGLCRCGHHSEVQQAAGYTNPATGTGMATGANWSAREAQQDQPTESVIYEVVGDWGVDSADSAESARAAVAKWLRAYPKCGAHAQQRVYREWPDGSEFYGPWTDLPEQPTAVARPGQPETEPRP